MMSLQIKPAYSLLTGLVIIMVILLQIAGPAMCADDLSLFYAVEKVGAWYGTTPAATRKIAERRMLLDIDEYGDVVIRHANVSLILAYNTPDDGQGLRDRVRDLQPRECAAMNGFSVKMVFTF